MHCMLLCAVETMCMLVHMQIGLSVTMVFALLSMNVANRLVTQLEVFVSEHPMEDAKEIH